ncbi:hypothetical protein C8J57DRAFT_1114099 [Mycena rebaudengoi]|nr:hypothetical protein C8J57DRAFT_1114099 [Mycena rebaudengoi]
MMMVNTSGTCATTRLIQCRNLGVYMNDVTAKFERSPENATDLTLADFTARKKIIEEVGRWSAAGKSKVDEWAPILYLYEIVKASAKRERDWGHLVFTDLTTTRYLLIMIFPATCNCGNFSHHDYDALTKYQADRFISLLKYLHHEEGPPKWVRATYVTGPNDYALDPLFLKTFDPPSSGKSKIFHVTSTTFVPSLLSNELDSIDNLLGQGNKKVPTTMRSQVLGSKDARPDVSEVWKSKNPRQCAQCAKINTHDLLLCSRCKLVHYCGRECQKLAWPSHKLVCKQTKA